MLVPEISEPYAGEVMSGIEGHLLETGYHYLVASHRRSNASLLHEYLDLMRDRAVEGLILVASELHEHAVAAGGGGLRPRAACRASPTW